MTPTTDQPKQGANEVLEIYRQAAEEAAVATMIDALMAKWPESTTTVVLEIAEMIRKEARTKPAN